MGIGVLATMYGPRRDVDLWWHVLLGSDLLAGRGSQPSAQWAVMPGDPDWVTGQPLAQMALALAERLFAGTTPTAVRSITAAAALVSLVWTTMPWRRRGPGVSGWWAGLPWLAVLLGAWTIMGFSQERPAQVALVGMPWVGLLVVRLGTASDKGLRSRQGRVAVVLAIAVVGTVWSLSHQSWLLAAATLGAAAVVCPQSILLRCSVLVALAVPALVSAQCTGGALKAVGVLGAGEVLVEWRPTDFTDLTSMGSVIMVCAFCATWVVSRRPPDRTTVAALLVLGVAAGSATRHAAPALLAAAPMLAAQVRAPAALGPPVSRAPVAFTASMVGTLAVVIGVSALRPVASPAEQLAALGAAVACHSESAPVVATTYNDSGPVLHGARRSGCPSGAGTAVVIDGRFDRYGADAVRQWAAVIGAEPGWQQRLEGLGVTAAVLPRDAALTARLSNSGWATVAESGPWLALQAPAASQKHARAAVRSHGGGPPQ